jgi:23S rRNA pseudouridine1911/1915/1917 synthase
LRFPIFIFSRNAADVQTFLPAKADAGTRLDVFLAAAAPELSRSRLQTLIKHGMVRIDNRPARSSERIREGQFISLEIPPAETVSMEAEAIPLTILYEDADLIVVNKPPGMVVHPAAGNREHTLVNALLHHCRGLSTIGGEQRPGIVHRLDKETSGCIAIAKNDAAHHALSRQFASRNVTKIYLALVRGRLRGRSGTIDAPIARHPVHRKKMAVCAPGEGRNARTDFRVVREFADATELECTLHTGRTHQIRVHLKHLGHPILGDAVYGTRGPYPRQMLHAWKLGFEHPQTGARIQCEAPLPADFFIRE